MPKGIYERTEETNRKNSEAHAGKKNPRWKGGQFTDAYGYVYILMPEHPNVNKRGYVRRAQLVAEQMLDRHLYPEENTHHKNGIKDDDRPENIEVMTRGEHTFLHNKIRKIIKEAST